MSVSIEPARAWAIVAGLNQYGDASVPALHHPVEQARRFVAWLLDRGVPPTQIFLCLSPPPAPDDLPVKMRAVNLRDARLHAIEDVLNQELRPAGANKELLLVYWGGHGILAGNKRALLTADATDDNLRALNLDSLLASLRSDHFPFRHQALIVDACANHFPNEAAANPLGFPVKHVPGDKRQFALFAAADGEAAGDDCFSPVVLDWLEAWKKTEWPPNLEELAEYLKKVFRELRNQGLARQTPVLFSHKPWDGEEQVTAGDYRLPRLLHGTRERLRAIERLTRNQWDDCYRRVFQGAKLPIPPADSYDRALYNLARVVSPKRIELLLEFALRIAERCGNQDLENWVRKEANFPVNFTEAKNVLANERFQAEQARQNLAYLMIEAVENNGAFRLTGWLQPAGGSPIGSDTRDCEASLESLGETIAAWIDSLNEKPEYDGSPLFIELFAPLSWLLKDSDAFDVLGVQNPFVLRVQERLGARSPLAPRPRWENLARRLHALMERNAAEGIFWTPDEENDPILLESHCSRVFGHRLLGVSVCATTDDNAEALLRSAVKAGIPYALWPRRPVTGEFKPPFDEAVRDANPWDQLPELLRLLRGVARKEPSHAAAAVTLLWDDPRRTPPQTISLAT
jgi:hypothetical protein